MNSWRAILACMALTAPVSSQHQAPLAPMAPLAPIPAEVLLLSRIQRHVRQELAQLPDYTCLETVERARKPAGLKSQMKPYDTMRLEVLFTGHKEIYSSPGERQFKEDDPSTFSASGMMGNGMFATHLSSLFVGNQAMFTYRGEEVLSGRKTAVYDFRIPVMMSGYTVHVAGGSGIVGTKGSFWADRESFDLLRLEIHADDIPPALPVTDVITIVNYARMRVGAADIMLPQTSELRMVHISGEESRNLIEFTHCRSFRVESTLIFGALADSQAVPTAANPNPAAVTDAEQMVPVGLPVTVALTSPITEKDAVGSLIEGKVSGNVSYKGEVLIADGAVVAGRIRRLDHHTESGGYFVIGLEFMDMESDGHRLRFYADLQSVDQAPGIEWFLSNSTTRTAATTKGAKEYRLAGSGQLTRPDGNKMIDSAMGAKEYRTTIENIYLTDLPGVGMFFVRGERFNLPKGLKMVWRTRALMP
jgi:hypothetical protein